MATNYSNNHHYESTNKRYEAVRKIYDDILNELGKFAQLVPRNYIYSLLQEKTGLSTRTLSRILNHS